jgi:hypothetical protein
MGKSSNRFSFSNLVFLSLALVSMPLFGAQAQPSCSELETAWRGGMSFDVGVQWNTSQFSCPGGDSVIALALHDLKSVEFTPNEAGFRPDFYGMVRDYTYRMNFDAGCSALARGSRFWHRITICPAFFKDSREDRASTLVHETRHLQPGDPAHVNCVGGRNDGQKDACDYEFFDGQWKGSGFNADIYYYNWMLKASKPNELNRDVMQGFVNSMIPDRFNHISPEVLKKWRGN